MPNLWCCTRLLSPDYDFDVYADGLRVGRVYRTTLDGNGEQWLWFMQLKQQTAGVQYSGQGETLEAAMIAFEANYSQASAHRDASAAPPARVELRSVSQCDLNDEP
jgi:hypothetical protein